MNPVFAPSPRTVLSVTRPGRTFLTRASKATVSLLCTGTDDEDTVGMGPCREGISLLEGCCEVNMKVAVFMTHHSGDRYPLTAVFFIMKLDLGLQQSIVLTIKDG